MAQSLVRELPAMSVVARAIGLSERTLQRRLGERGSSFERLFQEVRRQRTLELLAQPSWSVQAVARATGYHDASAFHRAFRAWTGMTPAVYRAQLQAAADPVHAAEPQPTSNSRSNGTRAAHGTPATVAAHLATFELADSNLTSNEVTPVDAPRQPSVRRNPRSATE